MKKDLIFDQGDVFVGARLAESIFGFAWIQRAVYHHTLPVFVCDCELQSHQEYAKLTAIDLEVGVKEACDSAAGGSQGRQTESEGLHYLLERFVEWSW